MVVEFEIKMRKNNWKDCGDGIKFDDALYCEFEYNGNKYYADLTEFPDKEYGKIRELEIFPVDLKRDDDADYVLFRSTGGDLNSKRFINDINKFVSLINNGFDVVKDSHFESYDCDYFNTEEE